jgi:wyosine [tRNA(Phe)-imidazoG37] synthetase (radical SAM superfamily)
MSLGVDMVPLKTCSLDCVYCECGATTVQTTTSKEYVPAEDILDELDLYLSESSIKIDVITFAGSGEPCLNSKLPYIIKQIRTKYPEFKTAILTNSTFLTQKEIRDSLMTVDYVLPSLDAVSQSVFEKINTPFAGLRIDKIIEGLLSFSKEYSGILWLEVFIIPGINDTEKELKPFKKILKEIDPTRVQLNTLDRPGSCSWVKPSKVENLIRIAEYLLPLPVEIIKRKINLIQQNSTSNSQCIEDIMKTLKRRPLTLEDISVSLGKSINETGEIMDILFNMNMIKTRRTGTKLFYSLK